MFAVMQTYDFIMLFVLFGLTIYGYSKGMAWQIAYLASFIASYFVATKFSGQLAPLFGDSAPWNKFVAMAAIYAATSLAIWILFRGVRGGIDRVKLQGFDRQMGAIIGAARGVLWCVGITFFSVTLLPDHQKQHVIASQSGRQIARLLDKADAVVPPELHQVIAPHLERLEQELNSRQSGLGNGFAQQGANQQQLGGNVQNGWPQQPATAQGWPQTGQANQQPNTPGGWPNNTGGWPAQGGAPTGGGTPARPAAWPAPQNGGWPDQQ